MDKKKACVFDLEKFAIHDGPGIRTVVFIKGCPVRCLWCHNPESQSFDPELLFRSEKCTACGKCAAICANRCHTVTDGKHSFNRSQCRHCGLCVECCPTGALNLVGRKMSVDEIMTEVLKDQVFYRNTGGGITLSGGEPLAHFDFSSALLKAAKDADIHTTIETSGFAPWDCIRKLLSLVDLWLWDVKTIPENHKKLTGVSAEPILENLKKLDQSGASIILRCPLVPGVNDSETELRHIATLANTHPHVRQIDLEPYHPLGEDKSHSLGREFIFHSEFASDADKSRWKETITSLTEVPVHI